MRFQDLPVGAHFRLKSIIDTAKTLPTVRVKVSADEYVMLHGSQKPKPVPSVFWSVEPVQS